MSEDIATHADVSRALTEWMDREGLPGAGSPLEVTSIAGGSQNELLMLSRGGEQMVLRRPPSNATPDRIQAFNREARLLRALAGTDVPHARFLGESDDASILGSPFLVMEAVDGWSPAGSRAWAPPYDTDLEARAGLAVQLVDGIARLARVDWKAVGLEGFGRPENFHERQVDRWLAFLADFTFRELPGLDDAAGWLRENRPSSFEPGILHGDYQFANVMYRHGTPARLAAIIDWEMATVGDPVLDLGWALLAWPPEGDDMQNGQYLDLTGMPPREELVAHYEKVSGRTVEDIDYYVVLARFKLGIVLEKSVARHRQGQADDRVKTFDPLVLELIRKAAELAATR